MFRKTAIERNAVLETENVSLSELEERIEAVEEPDESDEESNDVHQDSE